MLGMCWRRINKRGKAYGFFGELGPDKKQFRLNDPAKKVVMGEALPGRIGALDEGAQPWQASGLLRLA